MNLEITERSAVLAAPSIAPQNLFMQELIRLLIQLEPWSFGVPLDPRLGVAGPKPQKTMWRLTRKVGGATVPRTNGVKFEKSP
jgi:hypothetical protein